MKRSRAFPRDFSEIACLESYDPASADDNDFIENTVGLLIQNSSDDQTCSDLLRHVAIRTVVIDEV